MRGFGRVFMAKSRQVKSNFPDIYRPELNANYFFKKTKPRVLRNVSSQSKSLELDEHSLPIMKGSIKHVPTKRSRFKVVVRRVERPYKEDFEHQLAWICSSLGFFEPIDKDKNAAAVFKELVLATENGQALNSTAIAERIGMSRGAVINHLNNLLRSGLIEKNGRFYSARSRSMKRTIEEIEEDVERIFSQLKKTAEILDRQIGLNEDEE
jgi:predicted transcriptional regulator